MTPFPYVTKHNRKKTGVQDYFLYCFILISGTHKHRAPEGGADQRAARTVSRTGVRATAR